MGEIKEKAQSLRDNLEAQDQEKITGSVDLYEAMARALKYNLDYQVETQNYLLARADAEEINLDLLPDLVVSGSVSKRDSDPLGRSIDEFGNENTTSSRSSGRFTRNAEASLTWDVLDFGISYYRAHQAANGTLVAQEQRRRAANRLIEDVRVAYWRAVTAQRILPKVDGMLNRAERALAQSRKNMNSELGNVDQELVYQRDVLGLIAQLTDVKFEFATAKAELAKLINIAPNSKYSVKIPSRMGLPHVHASSEDLYARAAENRPELREVQYEMRNVGLERNAAALAFLPSLRPYAQLSADSNALVVNNNWVTTGVYLSWDIFRLARMPRRFAKIDRQKAYVDAQALALTQAILAQVETAKIEYDIARRKARNSAQLQSVSRKISQRTEASGSSGLTSDQTRVYEQARAVLADIKFDRDYANLQAAYARLYATVGENNYPSELTGKEPIDDLAKGFREMWTSRNSKTSL